MIEPLIVTDAGKQALLPPADTHQAVCFGVWDIGTQKQQFEGKPMELVPQICVGWELEAMNPETLRRFTIFKTYRRTLNEKSALSKDLTSWRGVPFTKDERKEFNVRVLVGVNCFIAIVHTEKQSGGFKAKISAITKLPKNIPPIVTEWNGETPKFITMKLESAAFEPDAAPAVTPVASEAALEEIPF